jgi:hypothetical protein
VQTADIGESGGPLKRWFTIHAARMDDAAHSSSTSTGPSQP